jgi:hypothetical protein
MAMELSRMDLALIVATALPQALEVRNANPEMPMVIGTCPGMVSNGFAQSLEHPGGIYTGMDELPAGVTARRLSLLKLAAPSVTRVALLSTTPGRGGHETQVADAETVASSLGVEVRPYRAASLTELRRALEQLAIDRMNGMLNFQGGLSLTNRQFIVDFAAEKRIPAVYQATLFAEAGGLMAWAPDLTEQFREAARFVAEILRGAKPGDLPIKQTTHWPRQRGCCRRPTRRHKSIARLLLGRSVRVCAATAVVSSAQRSLSRATQINLGVGRRCWVPYSTAATLVARRAGGRDPARRARDSAIDEPFGSAVAEPSDSARVYDCEMA